MTVVRSQLLRKRPREDRREGHAEEEEDDDYEDESESDGEDDDVDGLRLPNGFIILNDDDDDDDDDDYLVDYGNDDDDDREEESMGEEIECYFAGKNEYDCYKQGFKSRVSQRVPENPNVPNDAKGQRCCVTCYSYWRRKAPA